MYQFATHNEAGGTSPTIPDTHVSFCSLILNTNKTYQIMQPYSLLLLSSVRVNVVDMLIVADKGSTVLVNDRMDRCDFWAKEMPSQY